MLPRIIFILFTIAFIVYTWLHTGQAHSDTSTKTIAINAKSAGL